MAGFLRLLIGLALLPLCWAFVWSFFDAVVISAGANGIVSAEMISLLGGMAAFVLSWMSLSHPVKTYVFGHELTHAMWGLFFGARPSDLRIGESGGSVRLTKSNLLITLAPYFFPFYTFVVIVCAIVVYAFLRSLPYLPLWMFLIGFTWAFHVLFTLETLAQQQPDVKLYGRVFSWVFILLANLVIVLVWLASATQLEFSELFDILLRRTMAAYAGTGVGITAVFKWITRLCSQI